MTEIEELFSQLSQHMIEGLMTHSQLCDYFNFLGLKGYSQCHKYHYFEENNNYKQLCDYYLNHYNKLIEEQPFKNPDIIPKNWYQFTKQDVKPELRKVAIQSGFTKWIEWETKTKQLYSNIYQQLLGFDNAAAALEISKYLVDVDNELSQAEQKKLTLDAMGYDMPNIIAEQEDLYNKYSIMLKEIKL